MYIFSAGEVLLGGLSIEKDGALVRLANVPVRCNGMYLLLYGHLDEFSLEVY